MANRRRINEKQIFKKNFCELVISDGTGGYREAVYNPPAERNQAELT